MSFDSDNHSFVCENCRSYSVSIDPDTGEYYCEECGIQQQGIRELDRDLDDVYFETSAGYEGRSNARRAILSNNKNTPHKNGDDQNVSNSEYFSRKSNIENNLGHRTLLEEWLQKRPEFIKNSDFLIGIQLILQHTLKDMIERRQVSIKVLHFSKCIWFSFLKFVCNNNIQIRTFFADLRCAVLKVPFHETNSNISNVNESNSENIYCEAFDLYKIQSGNIFKDIFFNKMTKNRICYVIGLCNGIIKHSNSTKMRKRNFNYTEVEDKDLIIEDWEISARRLNALASQRKIPFTNWEGDSSFSRSETIRCVIDMIYEFDFLKYYFQNLLLNSGKLDHNDIGSEYFKWLDLHLYYYLKNKRLNQDKYLSVNLDLYDSSINISFKTEFEHQLNRVHIIHLLLCNILDNDSLKLLLNTSLSKYKHIKNIGEYVVCNKLSPGEIDKKDNTSPNFPVETPKVDHCLIICIIWAALLKSGYQVTSNDIIEWVRSGKIDIFRSSNNLPKWLKEAGLKWDNDMNSSTNTRSVTHLTRIPSVNEIEKVMNFLKKNLKVSIPQMSIPILIHRILVKCKCLSFTGGIAIQPLCIRLWELISNEVNSLQFNSLVIASSIIVVISRSVWPIFVYHPVPIPEETKYSEFSNSNETKFNEKTYLSLKNNKEELQVSYDTNLQRWEICFKKKPNLIGDYKFFCSSICGIEWSGILAINWLKKHLSNDGIDETELRNIIDETSILKKGKSNGNTGRPSKQYRGNFFSSLRRKRKVVRKKTGDKNWSGMPPLYSLIDELDPTSAKKIESLSQYLPSNREIFHSILNSLHETLNIISPNSSVQSWSNCDDEERKKLVANWKKVLETNRENDTTEVLRSILKYSAVKNIKPELSLVEKNESSIFEVENIENPRVCSMLDTIFINKSRFLSKSFQDPGIFTHIVFGLPQFFHSKQKFNNSEESITLPYISLLKNLSKITGISYLLIHSCVTKIEELVTEKLNN